MATVDSHGAPLIEELLPWPEPVDTCARFLGQPHLLFLDSAAEQGRGGRYSFLMADPVALVRTKGAGGISALDQARKLLERCRADAIPGLPPFQGGLAGYLAYDYGATLEHLPAPRHDDLNLPDAMLGLYDWVVAWDHASHRCWLISTGIPIEGAARARRAAERMARVKRLLVGPAAGAAGRALQIHHGNPPAPSYSLSLTGTEHAAEIGLRSSFTHRGYLDAVTRVREYIVCRPSTPPAAR